MEFQDEYKTRVHTGYNKFKDGGVHNPYHRSVCHVGYLGVGKYKSRNKNKEKN